jgi:hypothetical protein
MKIHFDEYDGSFFMELTAESIKEASLLARFAAGAKREPVDVITYFSRSGDIDTQVIFKRKIGFNAEIGKCTT